MAAKTPEVVGQYLVYEQIGRGGMATVHRAETQGISGFRKAVALKRLLPHLAVDEELVQAFTHEARLASHLRHANCAQTYDLGKVDDTYFIALEYVPGPTVHQIIKHCNAAAGLCPIPIVLHIVMQVLDGLDHAHNLCDDSGKPLGIVHRDVSPSNIIVSNTGVVKLIDFGIAKAETSGHRTQTGLIKGKFGYVAPEYTYGQLDARADLFAVGVIMHELLTGRRLFDGRDNFETIALLREGPIQPPSRYRPEITRDLDDIVLTALQRDPALRWQSAAAMRLALANLARDTKQEVTNAQLFEWVEWAFTQEVRDDDTGLVRVIDTLGDTGSSQVPRDQFDDLDGAETVIRTSSMYQAQTPMSGVEVLAAPPTKKIDRGSVWPIVVMLLALASVAAIGVTDILGYEPDWSVFR